MIHRNFVNAAEILVVFIKYSRKPRKQTFLPRIREIYVFNANRLANIVCDIEKNNEKILIDIIYYLRILVNESITKSLKCVCS